MISSFCGCFLSPKIKMLLSNPPPPQKTPEKQSAYFQLQIHTGTCICLSGFQVPHILRPFTAHNRYTAVFSIKKIAPLTWSKNLVAVFFRVRFPKNHEAVCNHQKEKHQFTLLEQTDFLQHLPIIRLIIKFSNVPKSAGTVPYTTGQDHEVMRKGHAFDILHPVLHVWHVFGYCYSSSRHYWATLFSFSKLKTTSR